MSQTNRLEQFILQHDTQAEFFLAEGLLGLFVPGFISTAFPPYQDTKQIFSDEVQLKWDYDNLTDQKHKSIVRKAIIEAVKAWSVLKMHKNGLESLLHVAGYIVELDAPEANQIATILIQMIQRKVTQLDDWENTTQLKFLTRYADIPGVASFASELMTDPEVRDKDRIFIFWILIKNNPNDVAHYMSWLFKENEVFKRIVHWKGFLMNVKEIVGNDRFAKIINDLDSETKSLVLSQSRKIPGHEAFIPKQWL